MRILVASVTNKEPEILRPHLASITSQRLPKGVSVEYLYVVDPTSTQGTLDTLRAHDVEVVAGDAKDAHYAVTEQTHEWSLEAFRWIGVQKQKLLAHAALLRFDAVWFVDSDLVCGPTALASLVHAQKPVVSGVFWTAWQRGGAALPQVWLSHPYEFRGASSGVLLEPQEFLKRLSARALLQVGGLGACTLIRANVFDKVGFDPPIAGLPTDGMWQGEDRHFCVRASRAHVQLWADAWPDIFHIYRDSDVARIPSVDYAVSGIPETGDFVSCIVEPMEERGLVGHREHVRGRLGALEVLPEIEAALRSLRVGDERFVKLTYPVWYEIPEYRGRTKSVLLRLLDAKRGAPFPLA